MRPQAGKADFLVSLEDFQTVSFLTCPPFPLLCDCASSRYINCDLFLFKRECHVLLFYFYFLLF